MTTPEEFARLLAAPEGDQIEFKSAERNYEFDKLVRYVVALANEGGGTLVLGATDRRPREVVGTQAFQLWMNRDMRGLGWRGPAANVSGFVEPFDTWADMTHLLPEESWRVPVRSIAYFCSVLADPGTPESAADPAHHEEQRARVRDNAVRFLDRDIASLWPDAATPDRGFRWEVLACEGEREGRADEGDARFDRQFWTANISPSERYVLSLPGTSKFRVSPLDLSFDNLTITGDWTETGLNTGCVESAVISGLLAAHAIAGSPRLENIIGYDHP